MQIPLDQAEFLKLTEVEGALQVRRQRLRILIEWDPLENPGETLHPFGEYSQPDEEHTR